LNPELLTIKPATAKNNTNNEEIMNGVLKAEKRRTNKKIKIKPKRIRKLIRWNKSKLPNKSFRLLKKQITLMIPKPTTYNTIKLKTEKRTDSSKAISDQSHHITTHILI